MDLRVGFKQHTFSRVPEFRSSHGRNEQLRERNQQRSGGFHLKSRNHQGWGLNPSPASGSRAVVAGTIGNLPRDRFRVQKLDMEMRRISTSQHCSCEFQLSIASKGKTKVCVLCFKERFTIPWAARSVLLILINACMWDNPARKIGPWPNFSPKTCNWASKTVSIYIYVYIYICMIIYVSLYIHIQVHIHI